MMPRFAAGRKRTGDARRKADARPGVGVTLARMSDTHTPGGRTTVAVHGATGYAARELLTILLRHPGAEVTALTTRRDDAPHAAEVHPALHGRLDLRCENLSPAELAERAEVVFCCTPHGASMAVVPGLLDAGAQVIDLSADYRLNDADVYRQWYGLEHTDPGRLGRADRVVYGLPELNRSAIAHREFTANPGCYSSAAILALYPLLLAGAIEPRGIVVDAKSGASGAGRGLKDGNLFCEVNENFRAYACGDHRHQPEIEQEAASANLAEPVDILFTPHLVPMDRGILATCYAAPRSDATAADLRAELREFYAGGSPFVRVRDDFPTTAAVRGTNFCDLSVRVAKGRVVVFAALDNLVKGAAGVAVQNFNLMTGRPETCGFPEVGG